MELRYKTDVKLSPRAKLMGRMKLGIFFTLPEKEFSQYIKEIEEAEIFQELLNKYRVVRYRKFPGIRPAPPSLEFKEEFSAGDNFDLAEFIQNNPESWQVVKKVALQIGEEKFSLLLKGNESISFSQIFQQCTLSGDEIEKFKDFINNFQLQQSFFTSDTSSSSPPRSRTFRVAWIENQNGKLYILPVDDSTYLVKGKYVIDYERWEKILQDKQVPDHKVKKISSLFRKLDMINRRTTTLYQIIDKIKEKQYQFLLSGNLSDIVPLTQREIAKQLKVNPSTISRAIADKSIITPRGEERLLKEFFLGEKEKIKALIFQIIREEKKKLTEKLLTSPLSDEKIRKKLKEDFGIEIARRTVTKYRKELKIPSSIKRDISKAGIKIAKTANSRQK